MSITLQPFTQFHLLPLTVPYSRAADNGRTPDIIRPSVLFIRGKKFWSVTMSGQDQGVTFSSSSAAGTSNSPSEDYPLTKKRALAVRTFEKENDKLFNTRTWLVYEKVDREFVSSMKCKVCVQFKDKLASCRNFSGLKHPQHSCFKLVFTIHITSIYTSSCTLLTLVTCCLIIVLITSSILSLPSLHAALLG